MGTANVRKNVRPISRGNGCRQILVALQPFQRPRNYRHD